VGNVKDQGAAELTAVASLVASNDAKEVAAIMDKIPDPAGTLYRYGIPASLLFKHARPDGSQSHGETSHH
jgi:F420-non-reducing hydrogenase small subunit